MQGRLIEFSNRLSREMIPSVLDRFQEGMDRQVIRKSITQLPEDVNDFR
jgi:hypothetical protein